MALLPLSCPGFDYTWGGEQSDSSIPLRNQCDSTVFYRHSGNSALLLKTLFHGQKSLFITQLGPFF